MLGAGWASLLAGRNEAAVDWLERSVAITPASGRAHLPDSTARNISLPARNASDIYLRARQDINRILVEFGFTQER